MLRYFWVLAAEVQALQLDTPSQPALPVLSFDTQSSH